MKKILYLHGLESKQGGEKVGFLRSTSYIYEVVKKYKL